MITNYDYDQIIFDYDYSDYDYKILILISITLINVITKINNATDTFHLHDYCTE